MLVDVLGERKAERRDAQTSESKASESYNSSQTDALVFLIFDFSFFCPRSKTTPSVLNVLRGLSLAKAEAGVREAVGEVDEFGGEAERDGAGEGDFVVFVVVTRIDGFSETGVGRECEVLASGEAIKDEKKKRD